MIGGPFIEAVPSNIHRVGNQLLVPLLTGFPFVPGLAEIRSVSLKNGSDEQFIGGLTSAIDVLKVDGGGFYTLEFSTNMLAGAPGRLRYYATPDAAPVNVLSNLITPTSMTRDEDTGTIYITNIGPGTITKVTFP